MNRNIFFYLSFYSMLALGSVLSGAAYAESNHLTVEVELPSKNVAEYHKPYVAIWIEDSTRKATQVALWYDLDMKGDKGKKWLKDIRQWWRRIGRKAEQPFDGLTSATKGPGKHIVSIDLNSKHLETLAAGEYQLRIEASREVGGKEVLNIPILWPLQSNEYPLQGQGKSELGAVRITFN